MQSPRANRSAHEFERDRGWRGREFETEMHDPRSEPIPQRYQGDGMGYDANRTDEEDRYPTGTMQAADGPGDATPWDRRAGTRFAGRDYRYPGGTRYSEAPGHDDAYGYEAREREREARDGEREARERAHFDENWSWDPSDRDGLWRRGEYGSRLYGNVVGAATPSGTAGIRRYRPGGVERRGPKGYARSDERMRDDICERLSDETWIDLSEVDVHVDGGHVRLEGEVHDRFSRYAIEDIADGVWGVKDVDNRIRVRVA